MLFSSRFSSFYVNLEASLETYSEPCQTLKIEFFAKIILGRGYLEHSQTSKMELFPKIVNS